MFLNCAAWILLTCGAVDPQLIDTASHTTSLRTSGGTALGTARSTATFLPRLAPTETQTAATHAALASLVPGTRCGDGNSACLCRALPKGRLLLPCHRWFGVPRQREPGTTVPGTTVATLLFVIPSPKHLCSRTARRLDVGHVPTPSPGADGSVPWRAALALPVVGSCPRRLCRSRAAGSTGGHGTERWQRGGDT